MNDQQQNKAELWNSMGAPTSPEWTRWICSCWSPGIAQCLSPWNGNKESAVSFSFLFSFLLFFLNIKNVRLHIATHEHGHNAPTLLFSNHISRAKRSRSLPVNRHLICSGGLNSRTVANKHWRKGRGEDTVGLRWSWSAQRLQGHECNLHFDCISCARFMQLSLLILTSQLKCFTCTKIYWCTSIYFKKTAVYGVILECPCCFFVFF